MTFVITGGVASYKTELSVEVEATLLFPEVSVTLFAKIVGIIVPPVLIDEVAMLQVILFEVVGSLQTTPPAVPPVVMSLALKVEGLIGLENTNVKFIIALFVGSTWPDD